MPDFRKQLLAAFEIEHREHLAIIRAALEAAGEGRPFDLKDVFRRAHSLKGAARAVDLPAVEELAHRLEAVFTAVSDRTISIDRGVIRAIELALDRIESIAAAVVAGRPAPDYSQAASGLDALLGARPPAAAPPPKAAAASSEAAERPPVEPAPASAPAERAREDAPPAEAPALPEEQIEYLRVAVSQVERLSTTSHQLGAEILARGTVLSALASLDRDARALVREIELAQRQEAGATGLRDLDRMAQALSRQLSALRRRGRHADWSLSQAALRVREEIDRIALVPVEAVFGGFGSAVRELGRDAGRDIEVRTTGFSLNADRRVLQILKDPLLHVLRNAISHGIEPAEERARRGKPAGGEITIACSTRAGRLRISITDDGRGPDMARIEKTARERGLLPEHARTAAPDRLLSLVFEPGFSTATEVDRLAGRGMGLSVVAEAVRKLHGSVLMRPQFPHGTELVISVPVTLARQAVVIATDCGERFALPIYAVERLMRVPAATIESSEGRPVFRIDVGGQDVVVPIVPLGYFMTGFQPTISSSAGHVKAVLIHRNGRRFALAVEELDEVRSLIVEDIGAFRYDRALMTGVVMTEADQPVPVISPDALIERWLDREDQIAAQGVDVGEREAEAFERTRTILVVDDSITTRTLEKSILEAQGYRVLLSVDGLDALGVLRSGQAMIDLVLADVEMPRMDGFGLLQAIKSDAGLSEMPVILMTSRADAEDVRRGLDLGASAYLTKQKFDQRELLATIGQLL